MTVEGDEGTATVGPRKLPAEIDRKRVGCPMAREGGNRPAALRARPDCLAAIAAVFGGQHQLALVLVVVAFGPAIVGTCDELDQFLGRKICALFGRVEARPILMKLIASVLRSEQAAGRHRTPSPRRCAGR